MKITPYIGLFIFGLIYSPHLYSKPDAQITFHVITDDGKPVQNAPLEITTFDHWQRGEGFGQDIYDISHLKTDSNGEAILKRASESGNIQYNLYQMPGYYNGGGKYQFKTNLLGRWQPWNPTVDLIVKPITNPIPMYAQNVGVFPNKLQLPAFNTPIGFDLDKADFVAPYGKGTVPDLIFTFTQKIPFVNYQNPFDYSLTINFRNKGDGIQSVATPTNNISQLLLPRFAPSGGYQSNLVLEEEHYLDKQGFMKSTQQKAGGGQSYFYRVRSILDDQGNIKSAHYGKIVGAIQFRSDGELTFTYYLNPNPNDRNMEFDPRKNLFQNLTTDQQVKAP